MNGHPEGDEHTREMIRLAGIVPPEYILDMGAGNGNGVRLLRSAGFIACGIDLVSSRDVEKDDLLHTRYGNRHFDAVLAQCSFFVSRDVPGAFAEACRILKPGGCLMYSDVGFTGISDITKTAEQAGFDILYSRDMTAAWREYYIDSLWRDTAICLPCSVPKGKCGYYMLICRKGDA